MMSQKIDPEAMEPTAIQSFEFSDRNPVVTNWGEGGGQIASPDVSEQKVTAKGLAVSADEGLKY